MNIKVYCPCGARFAFDVEPREGRMPVAIACPTCGEDATELANYVIQRQSVRLQEADPADPAAVPPQPTVALQAMEPRVEAPPKPRRVVARPHSAPQPAGAETGSSTCRKHEGSRTVDTCRVCGQPICRKCMALFGYVCSPFCRNKAEAEGIEVPEYAGQRSVRERKARNRTRLLLAAAAFAVLLLITAGVYYKTYASKPHIVLSQPLAGSDAGAGTCRLLDGNTYLSIAGGHVSLHDLDSGEALWRVPLGEASADSDSPGRMRATLLDCDHDIWILSGNRVLCHDHGTGELKHQIPVEGYVTARLATDQGVTLLAVSDGASGPTTRTITRIGFVDGAVTTHPIPAPEPATAPRGREGPAVPSFVLTGPNVVALSVTLLEEITIAREAIKTPAESILDGGAVSGANSMQAAEELLNEITRTVTGGKEYEDASRYQVTLKRHLEPNAAEWSGEVIGQVQFHPLQTVDLLVAGRSLRVFDKQNNLKWQAALTYPVSEWFESGLGQAEAPAVEAGATLFFFDKGMLTAFDLATGVPQWRVTSVGITRVQADARGDLYLCTTTANAEDIEYSQQIKVMDKQRAVLMKVEGRTGKVLWQTTMAGDDCILTGRFVYSTNSKIDFTAMLNPGREEVHFRVYRINPGTGERIWTYYQPRAALDMDFRENVFLLQFPNEIQLLKYTAL